MASSHCADFVETTDFNLIPADKKIRNKKGVKIKQEGNRRYCAKAHYGTPHKRSRTDLSRL